MSLVIRPGTAADVAPAERVFRLAFGTFLGLPDPLAFSGAGAWIHSRFRTTPDAFWVADDGGQIVGSVAAVCWGSVGFFGPLTVEPARWDGGLGQQLLAPVMAKFDEWDLRHRGLYTFADSAKHVNLYAKFGFWPGHLMAIMGKGVAAAATEVETIGALPDGLRTVAIIDCRLLADTVHPGLDLTSEIDAILAHGMGDVVLCRTDGHLDGFAVCHVGAGTEADAGLTYVKFAAVRPGDGATARFDRLLATVETFAATRGCGMLVGGCSMGRRPAYERMRAAGFRTVIQGVTLHQSANAGYHDAASFVLDDWR